MDLYLAGNVGNEKWKASCDVPILESFHYITPEAEKKIPYIKTFLLDGGAFTFFSGGHDVVWEDYVDRYADFINRFQIAPRVLAGSSLGLLAGDFVNDKVFQIMKRNHAHEHKGFAGRSIFSSVLGEIADTSVFVPIAFGGLMSIPDVVVLGASGVFLKLLCEVVLFPATNIACKKIKKAEGVDEFAKKG